MRGYKRRRGDAWRLEISAGLDPDTGKYRRYSETFKGSAREADERLRVLVEEIEAGVGLELNPRRMTLAEFIDREFIPWRVTQGAEPSTVAGYRNMARVLDPKLAATPLAKVTTVQVTRYVTSLTTQGLAPATVRVRLNFLKRVLNEAVRWQVIRLNPAAPVTPPAQARRPRSVIEPADALTILKAALDTEMEVPVALALGCGLRRQEALALRWSDVDLEAGELHVRQALGDDGGRPYFKGPKSSSGARTVPLPVFVQEILNRHRVVQAKRRLSSIGWTDHDLVCPAPHGQPWRLTRFTDRYAEWRHRTGLPSTLRFHDLRHGFADLAGAAGVDLNTLKELMGHASVAITADIYQRIADTRKREVTSFIDALMGGEHGE